MPVYYMPTWGGTGTASTTTTTTCQWVTVSSSTATTTGTVNAWVYYYPDNGTASTVTWHQPQQFITPARLYIARRSQQQALADDLHDHYLMEQTRQQRDLRRQHDDAARTRSLELLLAHLSPEQRETFERNKWFIVEGGKSGQKYRIRNAGHVVANIDVLGAKQKMVKERNEDGERAYGEFDTVTHRLCGHCDLSAVPLFDQLLAQKMMLEFDEERFLKLANKHQVMAA